MKIISILTLLFFITFTNSFGTTYYSLADGDWKDAIWSTTEGADPATGVNLPNNIEIGNITNGDIIIIQHVVTNSLGVKITNNGIIIIESGGYFDVSELTMKSGSAITVDPGGTLDADIIDNNGGDIINDGTIVTDDCTLIDGTCVSSPLPVELTYFELRTVDNTIVLYWSTASEINNDYFSLEKSKDGRNFVGMGTVSGKGTTNILSDYSFVDNSPHLGLSYYRLSQTDYDGTTEIFPVISVIFTNKANNFSISPNPVSSPLMKLKVSGKAKNELLELNIMDLQGRLVEQKIFKTDAYGNIETEIQLTKQLQKGTYIFELISGTRKEYLKVAGK